MATNEETKNSSCQPKNKPFSISSLGRERKVCLCGSFCAFVMALLLWSVSQPRFRTFKPRVDKEEEEIYPPKENPPACNLRYDPPEKTFYDDARLGYSLEKLVKNWNEKRRTWLHLHPSFLPGTNERVVMVTGSQPKPCQSSTGDYFLLRLFKNKVDYCRIHGYDILYENALLHPKMFGYWAKYAAVKAAMLAHPEAEWIWWVDSDAVITDMEFKLPLERYRGFNVVAHGWKTAVLKDRSWTGLNAGVFLIRNCQWSMDFMANWANMGPMGASYERWGEAERAVFKDKMFPESDDQTALTYMLYKNPSLLEDKVYLEGEYYFQGYWLGMVPKLENGTAIYEEIERADPTLRRRRAEKSMEVVGTLREAYLKKAGVVDGNWKRPFITHFTGCQPCSGDLNRNYNAADCDGWMVKALNFADNQVLRSYGFMRPDLKDSDKVVELPFDYPTGGPFERK